MGDNIFPTSCDLACAHLWNSYTYCIYTATYFVVMIEMVEVLDGHYNTLWFPRRWYWHIMYCASVQLIRMCSKLIFPIFFSVYYTHWLEIEYFCGRPQRVLFLERVNYVTRLWRAQVRIRAGEAANISSQLGAVTCRAGCYHIYFTKQTKTT